MNFLIWLGDLYTKYLVWRYGTKQEWEKEKIREVPLNTAKVTLVSVEENKES